MLYEVAIIEIPTEEDAKKGATEKLILAPVPIVAKDPSGAAIQVALQNKDKITCDFSRAEVLVRPFVSGKA